MAIEPPAPRKMVSDGYKLAPPDRRTKSKALVDLGPIRPKQGRLHLPAVGVVAPRDPGGAKVLSHGRLPPGVEIGLLNLVTLCVIGPGNTRRADAFTLYWPPGGVEIGFHHFDASFAARSLGAL